MVSRRLATPSLQIWETRDSLTPSSAAMSRIGRSSR